MSLRIPCLTSALVFASVAACLAAAPPNFGGTWVLNSQESKNLGMMAAMQDTCTIQQTPALLTTSDAATFNGDAMPAHVIRYDLEGKSVANTSETGERARTVSHWEGNTLVTEWSTEGSVAGSVHKRIERRELSADGRTMTLVSEAKPGDPKALVMVFDRK